MTKKEQLITSIFDKMEELGKKWQNAMKIDDIKKDDQWTDIIDKMIEQRHELNDIIISYRNFIWDIIFTVRSMEVKDGK